MPVGQVRDADRRVGGVDALAARAGRAVDVDAEVLLVDVDVVGRSPRPAPPRRRRTTSGGGPGCRTARSAPAGGCPARPRACRRRTGACTCERRRLDPRLFGVGDVVDVGGVPVLLGPAQVHAHEHLGEVGGVDAARLGPDRDQRLALVVLARQQRADLQRGDLLPQLRPIGVGVGGGGRVRLVLGELVEHRQVIEPAPQVLQTPQLALGVREAAGDLLRGLLVVPQVGLARLVGQVGDLGAQPGEVGHRLDALQSGGELLEVGCSVGVHNAPGYAVSSAAAGMASSSVSIASRCAIVKSATARAYGSSTSYAASCAAFNRSA